KPAFLGRSSRGEHSCKRILAGDEREQDQPGKQRQPAQGCDQQRLNGGAARGLAGVIEPDQQERGDRGQFPEDEQCEDVVGQNQPQHRPHEHQDEGKKPPLMRMPGKIAARIDDDEGADARDENAEDETQPIDEERKADTVGRYPFEPDADDREVGNRSDEGEKGYEDRSGNDGENPAGQRTGKCLDRWREKRRNKRRNRDQRDNHIKPRPQSTPLVSSSRPRSGSPIVGSAGISRQTVTPRSASSTATDAG